LDGTILAKCHGAGSLAQHARLLVELIVLNIAYNAHVFSPTLFTMLVVMALVTTMITTPILNLLGIENRGKERRTLRPFEAA